MTPLLHVPSNNSHHHHHHHQVRAAGERRRVVAPPCPRSTARLQSSPVGRVESFRGCATTMLSRHSRCLAVSFFCKEQCQVHAGQEDHARPGWTKSRRGQDSPWKSQSERQRRTEINGESTSMVWPTLGRLKKTERFFCCWNVPRIMHSGSKQRSCVRTFVCLSVCPTGRCCRVCCCGPGGQ